MLKICYMDVKEMFNRMLCNNISKGYRGVVILSGEGRENLLKELLSTFINTLSNFKTEINGLFAYEENSELKIIEDINYEIDKVKYEDSIDVLGKTYDYLILVMYKALTPDDLGRLIETVQTPGVIFILTRDITRFEEIYTTFHYHLLTPPYEIEDVRKNFEKRFKNKLFQYDNILIIHNGEIIKSIEGCDIEKASIYSRKKIIIPQDKIFSERIYRICLTQDQVNSLKLLENSLKPGKKIFLITADRGRGKSALLGLYIAALCEYYIEKKTKMKIGITAPKFNNVKTLFEFIKIGLKKNNIEFKEKSSKKIIVKEKIIIEYKEPLEIIYDNYDYVIVDEAAGIGINVLYKIVNKFKKVIFSSTIHGYEGAGRSFSVRFIKYLKEKKDIEVYEYKMKEPIRYSEDDPIEKWFYDSLLLDAEPADITEEDLKSENINFYKIPIEEWFEKDDPKLRQFIGIYILAHYQNRPNDVALIADAPHHDGFALEINNKIITAIQVAYEGGIPEETIKRMLKDYKPKGNIIPDLIAKHFRDIEFPKLKGLRIVRIATHPNFQGRGFGSIALNKITEWARENGYDWIGSSFGATYELLNFWQKNGFIVVHLSPEKNKVSGEYSSVVIKPLNKKTEKIIEKVNYEFRWRLINQISDVYFDIEPKLVRKLLETPYKFKSHFDILLTDIQMERAKMYFKGPMTYEAAADIVRNLFIYYLMNTVDDRPKLSELEEEILISKILLAWSFRKISDYFNISIGKARSIVKKASKKIFDWLSKDLS